MDRHSSCHNNRRVLECHDCIHNAIYSWCLSNRIIAVCSSEATNSTHRWSQRPRNSFSIFFSSSFRLECLRSVKQIFNYIRSSNAVNSNWEMIWKQLIKIVWDNKVPRILIFSFFAVVAQAEKISQSNFPVEARDSKPTKMNFVVVVRLEVGSLRYT